MSNNPPLFREWNLVKHKTRYYLVRRFAEIIFVGRKKSFVKPNVAFQFSDLFAGSPDGLGVRINTNITNPRAFRMERHGETACAGADVENAVAWRRINRFDQRRAPRLFPSYGHNSQIVKWR